MLKTTARSIATHVHRLYHHIALRVSRVELEILVLIILALFTPWWGVDRTMPWQKIWGQQISWASRYDIIRIIEEKQQSTISVLSRGETVASITPVEAGISYDVEALFRTLYATQAPVERLASSLSDVNEVPLISYNESLIALVDSLASANEVTPVDARLDFTDGVAKITPEKVGRTVDKEQLKSAITSAVAQAKSTLEIPLKDAEPQVKEADLQKKLSQLEALQSREPISIAVGKDAYALSSEVLAQLVDLEKLNTPEDIQLSRSKVANYVSAIIAPRVAKKGTPERIVTLDRKVAETTAGTEGSVLNEEALVSDIIDAFAKGESSVQGSTVSASAGVVAEKRYSKSATGLQFLLEDWDAETGGEWGVYVQDNTDGALAGSLNPDKQFVTASIYKLYVAAYTYSELEKETITQTDATSLGKSVSECMRVMIVMSDNSCPSYFFDHFGYSSIQRFVQENGYGNTELDNSSGGDKYTTARDTMKLLRDIDTKLITEEYEQELRGYMAQQIYRSGIPKGISGKTVQDKVGFLYGYNHDVGYVQGDKPYTIVILSNGASFSAIAELSRRIDAVMTSK